MATSEAQMRATLEYRKKNLSRITLDMRKEVKERIVKRAKELGISTQAYLLGLHEKDLKESKGEENASSIINN